MKKIIIIGAGHGGIITSSILSKNGFDITIYEKNKEDNLGYDWEDIFDITPFLKLGIPILKYKVNKQKNPMTIYNPSKKYKIKNKTNSRKIFMNRKELYKCLIDYAKESGVKFKFNSYVDDIIIKNDKVIGITVDNKPVFADLIIDSSGVDSKFSINIPEIEKIKPNEIFHIVRNIEKINSKNIKNDVFISTKRGISWIIENNCKDILIGSIGNLEDEYIDDEKKKLGVEFNNYKKYKIPVRRPLSQFVYNGYAMIGDSAAMTIPLNGSGLSLCALASKILSDVIIANKDSEFNKELLWQYQKLYYDSVSYSLSVLDAFKILLLKLDDKELNYIFKNINGYDKNSIIKRVVVIIKNIKNFKFIKQISNLLELRKEIKKVCKNIPENYDINKVNIWKDKYNLLFKDILK